MADVYKKKYEELKTLRDENTNLKS